MRNRDAWIEGDDASSGLVGNISSAWGNYWPVPGSPYWPGYGPGAGYGYGYPAYGGYPGMYPYNQQGQQFNPYAGAGGQFPVPGQQGPTPPGAGPVFEQVYISGSPAIPAAPVVGTPIAGGLVTVTAPTAQQFPWFWQNPNALWTYSIKGTVVGASPSTAPALGDPQFMSFISSTGNVKGTLQAGQTMTLVPQWQVIAQPGGQGIAAGKWNLNIIVEYETN